MRFVHDCAQCVFLGEDVHHDLYFCTEGGAGPTVVARFGNNGPEYTSGLEIALQFERMGVMSYPLVKALLIARSRGLLKEDPLPEETSSKVEPRTRYVTRLEYMNPRVHRAAVAVLEQVASKFLGKDASKATTLDAMRVAAASRYMKALELGEFPARFKVKAYFNDGTSEEHVAAITKAAIDHMPRPTFDADTGRALLNLPVEFLN